jgi:hypothetical protein
MRRLKPRHERFCQSFIECANATLAARAAGYTAASARNAGYRLLRHPRIVARITQLQGEMAQAHCRNLDILLGKLETIYRRAVDDHHFAAAARAVELQAKLAGLGPVPPSAARARLAGEERPAAAGRDPEPASQIAPTNPALQSETKKAAAAGD